MKNIHDDEKTSKQGKSAIRGKTPSRHSTYSKLFYSLTHKIENYALWEFLSRYLLDCTSMPRYLRIIEQMKTHTYTTIHSNTGS